MCIQTDDWIYESTRISYKTNAGRFVAISSYNKTINAQMKRADPVLSVRILPAYR